MKLFKKAKKGFTLIELVVVIAVIAILSTIAIISFISVTNKAKLSNDQMLVDQVNLALTAEETLNGKRNTVHETLVGLEDDGFRPENFKAESKDYQFVYVKDANRLALFKDGKLTYPKNVSASQKADICLFSNKGGDLRDGYSHYLTGENTISETSVQVNGGLDVGYNTNIQTINYANSGSKQDVVIRTNSYSTVLTIDAEHDTVTHYGKASKVDVTAVDNSHCYNEHGDIAGNINLEKGKVVVHNDCSAGAVVINMTAAELATVTTLSADNSANKEVPIILNTSEVLWGANPNNGLINPTTNNIIYSSTGGTLPENFNTMTNEQKEAAIASASNDLIQGVAAINNTGYPTLQEAINAAQDGDVIVLLADIALESSEKVTVNKTITLNMNEKTITGSAQELVQVGSSTTIGHLTIRGNGSISSSAGNMLTVNPNSTLDIYDGNYKGLTRTFNVLGGKVTTYGGSFSTTMKNQDSLAYLESACYCNFLGGTFTTPTDGNYGICIKDASVVNLGAKGEAGPSFSTWRPCISTNGMWSHAATIIINSGTYKSNRTTSTPDDQSVIQLANDSNQTQTLNVYGGYFEQTSAPNGSVFHVRYTGTININISGGSFKCLGSSLFTGFGNDGSGYPSTLNIRVNVQNNAIAGTQKVLMYGRSSTGFTRRQDLDFDVNP